MKQRILSAIVMIVIFCCCIPFFYLRILLLMAIGLCCAYEYSKNLQNINIHITLWVLVAYLITNYILTVTHCGFMTYIAWFTFAIFVALFSGMIHPSVGMEGALYTLSALSYPCFPFALIMYIGASSRWAETLAIGVLATVFCDSFALFGGMLFGKHKLAPTVSPNKTIEGSICGSLFAVLAGLIVYLVSARVSASPLPLVPCLVTAFLCGITGQIGDLVESMLKRYLGIKDFSNLIPGHGGVFDRADSIIFSLPTAYFTLYLFGL